MNPSVPEPKQQDKSQQRFKFGFGQMILALCGGNAQKLTSFSDRPAPLLISCYSVDASYILSSEDLVGSFCRDV